jgi:hypothetical protein
MRNCGNGTTVSADAIREVAAAGSECRPIYDLAAGQYVYLWRTDGTWAGQCRQLDLKLADGNTYSANFNFTK